MSKLLFLILVVIAGVLLWRAAAHRRDRASGDSPPTSPPPQRIVRCAHCDVHLPENEAIVVEGRSFCCPDHQKAFARRGSGDG